MHLSELQKKIADILRLNAEETQYLEDNFPDPLDSNASQWRPRDLCDIFGRERRGLRADIDEAIKQYTNENKPIPFNELDGE